MGRTQRIRRRHRKQISQNKFTACEYDSEYNLIQFMKDNGWSNESFLKVKNFNISGRGICSKLDMRCDDLIIRVPFDLMISIVTIENDFEFCNKFNNLSDHKKSISFQSLLAAYLIYKSMTTTKWSSYISTIPKSFSNPYFCAKNELQCLSDSLLIRVVEQNDRIKLNFSRIQLILDKNNTFFEYLTLDRFKWAYFAINTRSVFIDNRSVRSLIEVEPNFIPLLTDNPTMALVPFLDLFNHSDYADSTSFFRLNSHPIFELVTNRQYKKNHQIFISYGLHDNTKLLLEYGFIIPNNRYDYIEITLSDIEEFIKSHIDLKTINIHPTKFRYIKQHNLNELMFLQNSEEIMSHNLIVVLTLLIIDQSRFPNEFDHVAFGEIPDIKPLLQVVNQFIDFKIQQIQMYVVELLRIGRNELSHSGQTCLDYYEECNILLRKIKERL